MKHKYTASLLVECPTLFATEELDKMVGNSYRCKFGTEDIVIECWKDGDHLMGTFTSKFVYPSDTYYIDADLECSLDEDGMYYDFRGFERISLANHHIDESAVKLERIS